MAELLVVVAIIAVLVAIAIPVFSSQLEKSREATDVANIRSAYAEVMAKCLSDDRTGEEWEPSAERWQKEVPLKQEVEKWASVQLESALDGLCTDGSQHGYPFPNGTAHVRRYASGRVEIAYGGDYINPVSAEKFLLPSILQSIVGDGYSYNVLDSEEKHPGQGTAKFNKEMEAAGFDLEKYGAKSWTIYLKDSKDVYLKNPAIYYTPDKIAQDGSMLGKRVPVIGYRDGKYDVYVTTVVKYNGKDSSQYDYYGLQRLGRAQLDEGTGSATFQYDTWEEAKRAFEYVKQRVEAGSQASADALLKEGGFKIK